MPGPGFRAVRGCVVLATEQVTLVLRWYPVSLIPRLMQRDSDRLRLFHMQYLLMTLDMAPDESFCRLGYAKLFMRSSFHRSPVAGPGESFPVSSECCPCDGP